MQQETSKDIYDDNIKDLQRYFIYYKSNFVLNLQTDDNDFFHTYILNDNKYSDSFRTPSQQKLHYLKMKFNELLKNCNITEILPIIDRILSTNILIYLVGSRSEASLIFETTNDRGKLLTNIEKTKSYLMYKASLLNDSEQVLEKIQTRFNNIYQDYASFEGKQIGEDSILQYTFIAYENWHTTGKKEYQHYMEFMKSKVELFFTNNDEAGFIKYVEQYTLNIKESFSSIKNIFKESFDELKDLIALDILSNFYPLLIKAYRFDNNEKINFKIVCRLIEIFVFRVYVIQNYLTSKFQTKWYELAKKFDGDFPSLKKSIIKLIEDQDVGTDESFIKALCDNNFYNKYSSTIKNYFFWKYENYLRNTKQPISTLMPHEDLKKVKGKNTNLTIEHIVARKNSNEHSRVFADERIIVVGHGEKFNREYLNSIGNLTIDPLSANASKGAKDVTEKISKYFNKAPYKCQNELESYMINGRWSIESQNKRLNALIDFAKHNWCEYMKFNEDTVNKYDFLEDFINDEESD